MSVEIDLLKRAWTLLSHDEILSQSECCRDIQRYLDNEATKQTEGSPCCNEALASYRSFNKKVCTSCGQEYEWSLKDGQQPLIKYTR
jgi:hypothetical protein